MSQSVSAREAARMVGRSDAWVRKCIANGSLHAEKDARGSWCIHLDDVERLREPTHAHARSDAPPDNDDRDALAAELTRLHERLRHMEAQNERLTLLLSNEQALRQQALPLPRPVPWIRRVIGSLASVRI